MKQVRPGCSLQDLCFSTLEVSSLAKALSIVVAKSSKIAFTGGQSFELSIAAAVNTDLLKECTGTHSHLTNINDCIKSVVIELVPSTRPGSLTVQVE